MPEDRRAAWRGQFMTRAFACGIRKLAVMDASKKEQAAVHAYVQALPDPFPMVPSTSRVKALHGHVTAFRHPDRGSKTDGVWVLWAVAGTGSAEAEIPVAHNIVETVTIEGTRSTLKAAAHRVRIHLAGDEKMAPPVIVIDRANLAP
jgi:hypothetical protein